MLSTIADAPTPVLHRRRLILLAIRDGWANEEIVAALGLSRAQAYREIKAVREALERAERREP